MKAIAEDILKRTLALYPEFIEAGLSVLKKEASPSERRDRRMDLLFSDVSGLLLLVELKRGQIKDKDVGQLIRYVGEWLSAHGSEPPLRKMLVGTRVAPKLRAGLEHCGIECVEVNLIYVKQFLIGKGERELADKFDSPAPPDMKEPESSPRAAGAVRVRVGENRLGPSTFSKVMPQLYKILLTNRSIPPDEPVFRAATHEGLTESSDSTSFRETSIERLLSAWQQLTAFANKANSRPST